MTEDEQKKIFANNLNYYIANSGKQQKEIAETLGFPSTTFNTWCTGKILPKMGKVQAIADYFGILKSDLLEEKKKKSSEEASQDFEILKKLSLLTKRDKELICDLIESMLKRKSED